MDSDPGFILVISHDVVWERMAGPGIRYGHLARVLARTFPVLLAIPHRSPEAAPPPGVRILRYATGQDPALEAAIMGARVVVIPAALAAHLPALRRTPAPIVVDGYDPLIAETWDPPQGIPRSATHSPCR